MEYPKNIAPQLNSQIEQDGDQSIALIPLSNDGHNAAGWLQEALSTKETTAETISTTPVKPTGGAMTMGDSILRGMNSASQNYKKISGELNDALTENIGDHLSLQGALRLHMKFIEISMEAEVVSRVISKSTQHIDQLSKLQ